MEKIILTEEALAFEQKSQELVGKVVKNIFYKHDVEGYINTRAKGEKRFDYIPLSKMILETDGNVNYRFYDSSAFLNYYGFYTLDFSRIENVNWDEEEKQSDYEVWSSYIGQKIEKVEIDWSSLKYQYYRGDPSDIYPKGFRVLFSNGHEIVIVAGELELLNNGQYSFRCPDEALIICFSYDVYYSMFGEGNFK